MSRNVLVSIGAGFLLFIGFLLFDSAILKKLDLHSFPFFAVLSALALVLYSLLSSKSKIFYFEKTYLLVTSILATLWLWMIFNSMLGDFWSVGYLAVSIVTFFINIVFFNVGGKASILNRTSFRWLFLVMVALSVIYAIPFSQYAINNNWLALGLLMTALFYLTSMDSKKLSFILLGFVFFVSALILESRGTALASLLGALLILASYFPIRSRTLAMAFGIFLLVAFILLPIAGSAFYNSKYYTSINTALYGQSGAVIDSGRLERWNSSLVAGATEPLSGYGIDAKVHRINQAPVGASHNMFVDVFLKGGLVGVLILFIALIVILHRIIIVNFSPIHFAVFFSLFPLMSFYGLGGFTHWPGTYAIWLMLGVLARKSRSPQTPRTHVPTYPRTHVPTYPRTHVLISST